MNSFDGAGSALDNARPDATLTDFDRKVAASLNNPTIMMLFLQEFKEYMVQYLALNQPPLSISQVFGFTQFTAQASGLVTTQQGTSSTSYTDLATAGPTISGLPAGSYIVFVTAWAATSNATYAAYTAPSVNGAAPSDDDAAIMGTTTLGSVLGVSLQTLSAANNTIAMQYRVANAAATGLWGNRRLIVLKYANA